MSCKEPCLSETHNRLTPHEPQHRQRLVPRAAPQDRLPGQTARAQVGVRRDDGALEARREVRHVLLVVLLGDDVLAEGEALLGHGCLAPRRARCQAETLAQCTVALQRGVTQFLRCAVQIKPIYEIHKGWNEKTQGAKSWSELPAYAIKYVRRIEELLGVQVALLSTSPRREDTILVRNPFID